MAWTYNLNFDGIIKIRPVIGIRIDFEICNKLTSDGKWFCATHTLLIIGDPNFQTNKEKQEFLIWTDINKK
jgi:hypothetical protein